MADGFTEFEIGLRAKADVAQAEAEYDRLFAELKSGLAEALRGEGASPEFIAKFNAGLDEIRAKLDASGQADDFAALNAEVEKLANNLREAAQAEATRIDRLRQNVEAALADKDAQEEAAALQRRRREEDQLAMELEGIQLKKNTELLEQQIMEKLKAERVAREQAASLDSVSTATQKTGRSFGDAALAASYFVDDLQYGLRGVMNNIPQLLAMLGLGGGLAGIVGIAAVAVNFLWEKFGNANQAAQDADKATRSVNAMKQALDDTAKASEEAFKADLAKYTDQVERVTRSWSAQARAIQDALGYANQLAAVQLSSANRTLEIQRQEALRGAGTTEEREAINTDFNYRKAQLNDQGQEAAARRSLAAQETQDAMLRRMYGAMDFQRGEAAGRVGANEREAQQFARNFGDQSDQGRNVREYEKARSDLEQARQQMEGLRAVGITPETSGIYEAVANRITELQDKVSKASVGIESQRDMLAKGDLSFVQLDKDVEKAKTDSSPDLPGLMQLQAEAERQLKEITEKRKPLADALLKAENELKQIREAQVESEKQLELRRAQVNDAELATRETRAKETTDQKLREQKAAEDKDKKEREAQALQKENDAREAEAQGRPMDAVKLRAEAGMLRLPPNATAEERRRVALDADAAAGQVDAGWQRQAETLGNQAAAWAKAAPDRMGRASAAETLLANIAQQLQDGADVEELDRLAEAINRWGAALSGRSQERFDKILEIERQVRTLESQMRHGGRR